jgi:hypothetical protein
MRTATPRRCVVQWRSTVDTSTVYMRCHSGSPQHKALQNGHTSIAPVLAHTEAPAVGSPHGPHSGTKTDISQFKTDISQSKTDISQSGTTERRATYLPSARRSIARLATPAVLAVVNVYSGGCFSHPPCKITPCICTVHLTGRGGFVSAPQASPPRSLIWTSSARSAAPPRYRTPLPVRYPICTRCAFLQGGVSICNTPRCTARQAYPAWFLTGRGVLGTGRGTVV